MKEPIHLFHSLFWYTLADNDMCRSVSDLYKYRVHMESLHTRQSLELKKKTDCETWENMWNLYRYTCYSIEKSTTNLKYLNVFSIIFHSLWATTILFPSECICILLMSVALNLHVFINAIEINFLIHICWYWLYGIYDKYKIKFVTLIFLTNVRKIFCAI